MAAANVMYIFSVTADSVHVARFRALLLDRASVDDGERQRGGRGSLLHAQEHDTGRATAAQDAHRGVLRVSSHVTSAAQLVSIENVRIEFWRRPFKPIEWTARKLCLMENSTLFVLFTYNF